MQAKALAQGISEIELKVLEATNADKWGPHGNDMKGEGTQGLACNSCRVITKRV
jgi:hypothetical protein